MSTATVVLARGRERSARQGHPWIYSGAVARAEGPDDSPLARVISAEGETLGVGFYSAGSRIPVRLVRADDGPVDRGLFRERIAEALALRRRVVPASTTGYRILNAEGDFLPGWTVDRFGDTLVSQITSAGLERLRSEAYAALRELVPHTALLQRNRGGMRRREGLTEEDELIAGAGRGATEARFTENGFAFTADLAGGQKTGFYCDQRPNRQLAETFAGDAEVLDLFSHSGAFTLYALRGGARSVVTMESAARLNERARRHLADNGLDAARVSWIEGNAFDELRRLDRHFDLIVCDPPPLVRRRADLDAGARAYKDLNRQALMRLAPGGFLLTFSCSAAVDPKLFRQILFAAAVESQRRVVLLDSLGAGPDHPIGVSHLEGEYLKGWLVAAR
ncbi:MAG TPA: class I SAM-dependent rRNA methyltransferase [Thermoanaerobaculia bacterium]|nr:class I SAM-dependent rRNA methyltransferase [Thermoanaerobaculia bacterium]